MLSYIVAVCIPIQRKMIFYFVSIGNRFDKLSPLKSLLNLHSVFWSELGGWREGFFSGEIVIGRGFLELVFI